MSMSKEDAVLSIQRLKSLKQNWNSYGANRVDLRSIDIAIAFVEMLAQISGVALPHWVAASPAGNVALSWECQDLTRELDVEVLPTGILRYSFIDDWEPSKDIEGDCKCDDYDSMRRLIDWVSGCPGESA